MLNALSRMALAVAAILAFGNSPAAKAASDVGEFDRLTEDFTRTHYEHRPLAAVALGWHQYDGQFVIPDAKSLNGEIERLKKFEGEFGKISPTNLPPQKRLELNLVKATIAYERWVHERQRPYWNNPMAYAGDSWNAMDVSGYLLRDFKPLDERFADITAIIRKAPGYLDVARSNLEAVLPKPFVETGIETANGTASFLEKDIAKAAGDLKDAKVRSDFEAAMKPAAAAFRAYADWLKKEKLPRANNSYALGREKYMEMLRTEFINLTPEEILERGLAELKREQNRFRLAAMAINPRGSPQEVAQTLQRDHPTAEGLIPEARKNLEDIRQFIVDHRILTIPSEERAVVEETLPPFRATSFASMSTPGPFEKKGVPAYYFVTPVEPDWTPKQKEEWLGAFNYYTLDVVSIHEAYPGHFVQFLHWNSAPLSVASKVFPGGYYGAGSYPFVEGWAHYCEQMMLQEGFGQPKNPARATKAEQERAAKYRLAQSSEALLRLCRLCCSVKLHCQGATVEEATRFIMDNAYYEEKPAHGEALRGTFDPGYLYYSLGKLMILKLRDDWKAQEGAAYSLQRFHDELLRHGAPPLPLLRRVMLRDPAQWPYIL
jgi:uncharacterized protein (DUF885 family)